EPVPKDVGTILRTHLSAELDRANRFSILHQLLVRQGALPVVLPPFGFPLTAVPVEAVRKQIARLLLLRPLVRLFGNTLEQPINQDSGPLIDVAQRVARFNFFGTGPRNLAVLRNRLEPPCLQPVTQLRR